MIIRKAQIEDAEGIKEIENRSFSTPWSLASIENDLKHINDSTLYYVLEEAGLIFGYAGAWIVADEGQITNVAVHPECRRRGNGHILVRKLIRELFKLGLEEVFLEVRISNFTALSLYRSFGFAVKGVRKDFYQEPIEDAYIMSVTKEDVIF